MRPGDLLRQVREQRKISLERAAEASRIRLRVLAAIESGETRDIPTVYLRGYVRNYARFLGVDPAEIEDVVLSRDGQMTGIIAEVGASMMLGGNILHYTRNIPTAIALETSKGEFAQGIALGMVLLIMAFLLNGLLQMVQGRGRPVA